MGLFSSIIHVKGANASAARKNLIQVVEKRGFKLSSDQPATRPPFNTSGDELLYLVSPLQGSWSAIIEGHFGVEDVPSHELAKALSKSLSTYTLALQVHDDDIVFYNLYKSGKDVDGYNSNPQYFENEPLSKTQIKEQRHNPKSFLPLLPKGVSIEQLNDLLNKGWWAACNAGHLDEDGLPPEDESGYVFEGERMIAIGNLLQLHGDAEDYPYASWGDSDTINWKEFHELRFSK